MEVSGARAGALRCDRDLVKKRGGLELSSWPPPTSSNRAAVDPVKPMTRKVERSLVMSTQRSLRPVGSTYPLRQNCAQ